MKHALLALFISTCLIEAAHAQDGTLDPSFGTGGIATTSFGQYSSDQANDEVIQPDGKIVVAGFSVDPNTDLASFSVARYNTNGTPDNSFAGSGHTITPTISGFNCEGDAIALQADGKILVAGSANDTSTTSPQNGYFVVVRYNADGSLDTSFGQSGIVAVQLPGFLPDVYVGDMLIQSDSLIVIAGEAFINMPDGDMVFVRLLPDGNPDPAFGTAGISVQAPPNGGAYPTAMALQPDGMIVVAAVIDAGTHNDPVMTRITDTGSVDLNFGSAGFIFPTYGFSSAFFGVALQADGKIVACGFGDNGVIIARFYDDGLDDTSFGTGGVISFAIGTQSDAIFEGLVIQADGKIIAAGYADNAFAMARVNSSGVLDPTFGSAGIVQTPIGFLADAHAIQLQADEKIVLAGYTASTNVNTPIMYAVARYNNTAVGIVESDSPTYNLYPNPCIDQCVLEFANISNSKADLELFDMQGKMVRKYEDVTGNRVVISAEGLEPGIYCWKLQLDGETSAMDQVIFR